MGTEELKWVIKEKKYFDVDMGKVEFLSFLHMNYISKYKNEMGGVKISDKVRKYYRIDFW